MAKLLVFAHGQKLTELVLESGQTYYAGRGDQCAIKLGQERGISRQHLKIAETDGVWGVSLVSKNGILNYEGQAVSQIPLQNNCRFAVPPYEFQFETPEVMASEPIAQKATQPSITADLSVLEKTPDSPDSANASTPPAPDQTGNFESTQGGFVTLVPHLKIINKKSKTEEMLKLEGEVWTIGRSKECEIQIDDQNISRKHFEISRSNQGYTITDLGSSNGTYLNGEKLPPRQPTSIKSGDEINVRLIKVIFEVHDTSFDQKVAQVANLPAVISEDEMELEDEQYPEEGYGVQKIEPSVEPKKSESFFIFKAGVAAALVAVGYFFFAGDDGKKDMTSTPNVVEGKITDEKNQQARSHFELALSHFKNGKFQLCLSQIELLHKLVPFYENSQEIESQCKQALELEQITRDNDRRAREKEEVENKIQVTVENCKSQMTPQTTSEQIKKCLEPALELSPEHPAVSDLVTQIEIRENEERAKKEQSQAQMARKAAGRNILAQAQKLESAGKLKPAAAEYRRFLSGGYGLPGEESSARAAIAKIEKAIELRLSQATADCKSLVEQAKYKMAIGSCDIVLSETPSYAPAIELRKRALGLLRKEMKVIWEEAVLAESYGNIEAAKEKWKIIVNDSVPDDEYYTKSRLKLKKHGAEF